VPGRLTETGPLRKERDYSSCRLLREVKDQSDASDGQVILVLHLEGEGEHCLYAKARVEGERGNGYE